MEDFDYIDALAKSELSGREATPSSDGWDIVQEKLKRKRKKRRLFLLLLFFVVIGSVGIYQGINFNSEIDGNSITDKNTEQLKPRKTNSSNTNTTTSDAVSDSTSISDSLSTNISQAEKDALHTNNKEQTNSQATNKLKGSGNNIVNSASKINSRGSDVEKSTIHKDDKKFQSGTFNTTTQISEAGESEGEGITTDAKGLQLYAWELILPETLKKKRKKRKKSKQKKPVPFYENTDIMIGLNGFVMPNDYKVTQSYVVEISYEIKKELKNDYFFNYGGALQLRTLRLKKDSLNFTKGEVSFNLFSNVEKQFGDYSVEAGAYLGYEIYSPNNEFFNGKVKSFFDQKINYGLSTGINYKNIGLIFKYELSPYINYLGDKKYGGFIIGVKYDF